MNKISNLKNISVLGDGAWGTTLAVLLANKKFNVTLWGAFEDYVKFLNKKRVNEKFLPEIKIPKNVCITADLEKAILNQEIVILAVPSQYLRSVLKKIKLIKYSKKTIFVSVTKGVEIDSLKRMSEVITSELADINLAVLSGPTIAHEVALGMPTTAVLAAKNEKVRQILQDVFMTERFRIYTSADIIGVELGGSLKNVIAIACGISDGLGFGSNAKAALLSRGLTEMARLGQALGAKPETFSGITGLGDLVTTCVSEYSRNRSVGEQIGRGKTITEIFSNMQQVAEGVPTTKAAYNLSLKYKIDMPIVKEVYEVLYNKKSAIKAVKDLMTRNKKEEY